ncbi:MAG: glycosyltransferase [Myxococcales bacterium]|nr:glycosyltransferase [Myxococcales bacterium]
MRLDSTSTNPLFSVIIPIRDRSGMRLENCLRSIRWQKFEDDPSTDLDPTIEIVISDYGSGPEQARNIDAIAKRFEARVVRTQTDRVWNRSLVLNIGIRAARGRYVLCTDADMLFREDFFASALMYFQQDAGSFICCRCHDLPESVPEQEWSVDDLPFLLSKATVRNLRGTGACQFARRTFFESVRGYDEGYKYWGSEDRDMLFRAERHGMTITRLDNQTAMFHQWHPTMRNDRWLRTRVNRWRYRLTKFFVVKNWSSWGVEQ